LSSSPPKHDPPGDRGAAVGRPGRGRLHGGGEDFASDVLAGVAYLKGRKDIDRRHIGLIGHSEGGLIAPMAAARSRDVGFIVLIAGPGVRGDRIITKQAELILRADGASDEMVRECRAFYDRILRIAASEPDRHRAEVRLGEAIAGAPLPPSRPMRKRRRRPRFRRC